MISSLDTVVLGTSRQSKVPRCLSNRVSTVSHQPPFLKPSPMNVTSYKEHQIQKFPSPWASPYYLTVRSAQSDTEQQFTVQLLYQEVVINLSPVGDPDHTAWVRPPGTNVRCRGPVFMKMLP